MARIGAGTVLREIGQLFDAGTAAGLGDDELLSRFVARRDEEAFAAILGRHAPLVWGVCRRWLRDPSDAEDAFQATFLVLARRAGSIREAGALGAWLYGVAYRTARSAKALADRRARREGAGDRTEIHHVEAREPGRRPDDREELRRALYQEIGRLPAGLRAVVLLCHIEGLSQAEAAHRLKTTPDAVLGRLARARDLLRGRLARRGVGLTSGVLLAALADKSRAAVPGAVLDSTAKVTAGAAAWPLAMPAASSAPVSSRAVELARGALPALTGPKLKLAATLLAVGLIVGPGASARQSGPRPGDGAALAVALVPSPDAPARKIVVAVGQSVQAAIDAAPEGAEIALAAGTFDESLTITKPLTLRGAGSEKTIVGPTAVSTLTQKQKDEFFAALEAARDQQERTRIAVAFATRRAVPALTVRGAKGVGVRGIRFRGPSSIGGKEGLTADSLVVFDRSVGSIADCAVVGPYMNGVAILAGADVRIERSLVAALWGTGVVAGRGSKLHLSDSDIRNCYHRCVTLGTDEATVERCRISGSAWHGIRYDNCSPKVQSNQIFGNARSGIYASGRTAATVRGNVFWRNEMDAMSCWFANEDGVEGNTIIGNLREGISVLGGARTNLVRNVFVDNPIAIMCGKVASQGQDPRESPSGAPRVEGNVLFRNPKPYMDGLEEKPLPPGNLSADPAVDGAAANFAIAAGSPARRAGAGALDPVALASPFPIQPGEAAMIPESETRDFTKWREVTTSSR